jgi:hypothetical protein
MLSSITRPGQLQPCTAKTIQKRGSHCVVLWACHQLTISTSSACRMRAALMADASPHAAGGAALLLRWLLLPPLSDVTS